MFDRTIILEKSLCWTSNKELPNWTSAIHRRGLAPVFVILAIVALILPACGGTGVTKSVNDSAYFYRLHAKYSHDGEPIDIDVVVGCSVKVTEYRGGDSGFLAAIFPRLYVHQTRDGHEVMQILPLICRGETTANGLIPADFLPGVIWFEKAGDRRFGIAHVSEDAFENPNGKLKFHGATVKKATLAEWNAFRKRAAGNEGFRERYYNNRLGQGEAERIVASRGADLAAGSAGLDCSGVHRHELSAAARAELRKYWPAHRPRFWIAETDGVWAWNALQEMEKTTPIFSNGFRLQQHAINYGFKGFATRARGGEAYAKSRRHVPPEFFPLQWDRGVPWIFSDRVARSPYLGADVDLQNGRNKGFFYCFRRLSPTLGLETVLPNVRQRHAQTRVDGYAVWLPKQQGWNWAPRIFFQEDRYLYRIKEWAAWP